MGTGFLKMMMMMMVSVVLGSNWMMMMNTAQILTPLESQASDRNR